MPLPLGAQCTILAALAHPMCAAAMPASCCAPRQLALQLPRAGAAPRLARAAARAHMCACTSPVAVATAAAACAAGRALPRAAAQPALRTLVAAHAPRAPSRRRVCVVRAGVATSNKDEGADGGDDGDKVRLQRLAPVVPRAVSLLAWRSSAAAARAPAAAARARSCWRGVTLHVAVAVVPLLCAPPTPQPVPTVTQLLAQPDRDLPEGGKALVIGSAPTPYTMKLVLGACHVRSFPAFLRTHPLTAHTSLLLLHRARGASPPSLTHARAGIYSCSCPGWRFQKAQNDVRTCKHLKALRGATREAERIGNAKRVGAAALAATKAQAPTPAADGNGAATGSSAGASNGSGDAKFAPMLADSWDATSDLTGWLLAEKLDGVRALWNGRELRSRTGVQLLAPPSWTAGLPEDTPLDGELWAGRGRFDDTSSIVLSAAAGDAAWAQVAFMVFDAPSATGGFEARLAVAAAALARAGAPRARVVEHAPVADNAQVLARLQEVMDGGGEGLMVRRLDAARCVHISGGAHLC
jgi:hypothetical protein